jgi:hypothetical protein
MAAGHRTGVRALIYEVIYRASGDSTLRILLGGREGRTEVRGRTVQEATGQAEEAETHSQYR